MDSRISIGDKLDLEKIETRLMADPEKDVEIYVSQVLDEGSGEHTLFVAMPYREGKLVPLTVGQQFHATFYTKSGLLRCKVEIMGRYKKGTLYLMEIAAKSVLQKVQRREYFRFECRTQIEYRVLGAEEKAIIESENVYDTDEWQIPWKNGIMLDISGGGIRLVSGAQEERDTLVQVRIDISIGEETDILYAFAKVLRSERSENNAAIFDVRLKFWRMDQGTRERIIRFIFEEQRRKRSKQLGLE